MFLSYTFLSVSRRVVLRDCSTSPPPFPEFKSCARMGGAGFQIYPPPTTPPEPAPPDHHMAPASMMRPYKGGGGGRGGVGGGGGHQMVSASQSSLDDITCKTSIKSFCDPTHTNPHQNGTLLHSLSYRSSTSLSYTLNLYIVSPFVEDIFLLLILFHFSLRFPM